MKKPVTVICTTFNQVEYIDTCLSSLIMQKTDFPLRIIIHDDASTDGTTEVVLEYASRYPDLITPVIQPINIYSKGESWLGYVEPYVDDDYIAICEGDDWWIDSSKLQTQYDFMQRNPKCAMCCHKVVKFDDRSARYLDSFPRFDNERDLSIEELIEGGGGLLGTNSFFYRSSLLNRPKEFNGWGIGDYPSMIYYATQGSVHYFPMVMSAYRVNAKGSWSVRINASKSIRVVSNMAIIEGLEHANGYTGGLYSQSFEKAEQDLLAVVKTDERNWGAFRDGELREWLAHQTPMRKLKVWSRCWLPETLLKPFAGLYQRVRTGFIAATSQYNKGTARRP